MYITPSDSKEDIKRKVENDPRVVDILSRELFELNKEFLNPSTDEEVYKLRKDLVDKYAEYVIPAVESLPMYYQLEFPLMLIAILMYAGEYSLVEDIIPENGISELFAHRYLFLQKRYLRTQMS